MSKTIIVTLTSTVFVRKEQLEMVKAKAVEDKAKLLVEQTASSGRKLLEFSFDDSHLREKWETNLLNISPKPLIFYTDMVEVMGDSIITLSKVKNKLYYEKGWEYKAKEEGNKPFLKVCFKEPIQRTLWEMSIAPL